MMKSASPISRRQALARLGLAAGAAYVAPAMTGLSRAQASSGSSGSSAASPASPASQASTTSQPSQPSGAEDDGCQLGTVPEHATISRSDMRDAQRAISQGRALPLREVVNQVKKRHPGRLINVGFSEILLKKSVDWPRTL